MDRVRAFLTASLVALVCDWSAVPSSAASERPSQSCLSVKQGDELVSVLSVELAATEEGQRRGLAGRQHIGNSAGMWFAFDRPRITRVTMAGMVFDLDVVFVGWDGRIKTVVSAERDAAGWITSPGLVGGFLELPRGLAEPFGLLEGRRVDLGCPGKGEGAFRRDRRADRARAAPAGRDFELTPVKSRNRNELVWRRIVD